jgi:hypothetical protein
MSVPNTGTGTIRVNLFDGARRPVRDDFSSLLRVLDGNRRQVVSKFVRGASIPVVGLPVEDGLADLYTVIVSADGFRDAAVYPVRARAARLVDADLMLLRNDSAFHFSPLPVLQSEAPLLHAMLANGAGATLTDRYRQAMEHQADALGTLLTIGNAVRQIPLPDPSRRCPLDYYWELDWDLLQPDRFWAWVDASFAGAVKSLADLHTFAEEPDAAHWHPGIPGRVQPATRSWKQTRFDVANVQLTFHELDRKTVSRPDGSTVECVIVEPDIDYYKDILSHGLLEVIPNLLTGGKTDPRMVYLLRWMATRQEGLGEFDPPCTIE